MVSSRKPSLTIDVSTPMFTNPFNGSQPIHIANGTPSTAPRTAAFTPLTPPRRARPSIDANASSPNLNANNTGGAPRTPSPTGSISDASSSGSGSPTTRTNALGQTVVRPSISHSLAQLGQGYASGGMEIDHWERRTSMAKEMLRETMERKASDPKSACGVERLGRKNSAARRASQAAIPSHVLNN